MDDDYCDPHYPHFNQQQKKTMTTTNQEADDSEFARSPTTDVFGKLDDELPPIRINGDVRIELRRLAAVAHMNESEFIRNLLHVRVYGLDHVVSMQTERLRRATGNVEQSLGKVDA